MQTLTTFSQICRIPIYRKFVLKTFWIFLFHLLGSTFFCKSKTQAQNLLPKARVKLLFPSSKAVPGTTAPSPAGARSKELGGVSDNSWGTACCNRHMGCILFCLFCQVLLFGSSSLSVDCTWNFRLQNTLKFYQQEFTDITPAAERGLNFPSKTLMLRQRTAKKTPPGGCNVIF